MTRVIVGEEMNILVKNGSIRSGLSQLRGQRNVIDIFSSLEIACDAGGLALIERLKRPVGSVALKNDYRGWN